MDSHRCQGLAALSPNPPTLPPCTDARPAPSSYPCAEVRPLLSNPFFAPVSLQDAFVELYGPSMRPLFDFSWLSLKALLSLALVGACITLGAYLGHK